MLRLLLPIFLLSASCATPTADTKVSVVIKNATDQEMVIRGGNGILSTEVRLKPGYSWSGWIDRRFILTSAFICIERPKPDP